MRKSVVLASTIGVLLFGSVLQAQSQQPAQPPFTESEEQQILRALIDRDEALAKLKELAIQLGISQSEFQAMNVRVQVDEEKLKAEHALRYKEQVDYLAALQALKEFRIVRRPLIIKILTLSAVRDKHDKILEAQIVVLQKELAEWD